MDTKVLAFCYVAEKGLGEIVFTRVTSRGRKVIEVATSKRFKRMRTNH